MSLHIEHSGRSWSSLGLWPIRGGLFVEIWPIEEYLVRSKHKPTVAARIARLNPNGKPEGEAPRGIHYTRTIRHSCLDVVSRETFEKKWGKGSYRRLLKSAFVPMGGRRRAVSAAAYCEGPP